MSDATTPERPDRWTVFLVLALTLSGAWRRAVDLDPPSLWLDDAWVAALARLSWGELFAFGSSSPPLFNAAVAVAIGVAPDPEVGAQLVPFVCGVAVIPVTGWLAWRVTRHPLAAVAATALVACHPVAIAFAPRVKQYSSDALLVAVELLLFVRVLERPGRQRLWTLVGVVGVGGFLSTVSLLVAACLVPVAAWTVCREAERPRDPQAVGAAAVALLSALVVYATTIAGGTNAALRAYWSGHYLARDALPSGLGRILGRWLGELLNAQGPAPGLLPEPVVLLLGGGLTLAGALWLRRERRPLLLALALLPPLLLGLCLAQRLPLGTGRVEVFLLPPLALLLGCGLAELDARRRALAFVAGFLLLLQLPGQRSPQYPQEPTAAYVAQLVAAQQPGDAVWVNLHGSFALAYYAPWPARAVADPSLGTGYHAALERPGFLALDHRRPNAIEPVTAETRRVWLLTYRSHPRVWLEAATALRAQGFRLGLRQAEAGVALLRFDR